WPRAASDEETQAFHLAQTQAKQEQRRKWETEAEKEEKQSEEQRQEIITQLEHISAQGGSPKATDPELDGKPLSKLLRNKNVPGPPPPSEQMLTLRQVTTEKEPDIATFELPISYDALPNIGSLRLLCDAAPAERDSDDGAESQECSRATNGNCRL